MKKICHYLFAIATISMVASSCSKSDTTTTTVPAVTTLTVSVDKSIIVADGYDKAVITVKDQAGTDITSQCLLIVGGGAISGNAISMEFGLQGSYEVYATKNSLTSNKVNVTVTNPGVSKYKTKVVAEDFTGAWCGWCPRLSYKFENFMTNNNRVYTVGVHNNDAYALPSIESSLRARFGVTSFPTAVINRTRTFNDNGNISSLADSTDMGTFLRKRMVAGLAINSVVAGNTLNVTTKVGFDATISQGLKLVVLLVQDGLVLPQINYYSNNASYPGNPYFSAASPIANFVHKGVLRSTPTGILGSDITASSQVKNGEFVATNTIDISGMNVANLKVVAFVVFADGQTKSGILNAQWAAAGTNQAYD